MKLLPHGRFWLLASKGGPGRTGGGVHVERRGDFGHVAERLQVREQQAGGLAVAALAVPDQFGDTLVAELGVLAQRAEHVLEDERGAELVGRPPTGPGCPP